MENERSRAQIIAWLLGEADETKADMATAAIKAALNGHAAAITFETFPDVVRGIVTTTPSEAHRLGQVGLDALGDPVFRQQLLPAKVINDMPPVAVSS